MKLQTPSFQVLHVYRVSDQDTEVQANLESGHSSENSVAETDGSACDSDERCIPLVLIEVLVDGVDDRFSLEDCTQEIDGAPKDSWQVAYDEALLSNDGTKLIHRDIDCAAGLKSARCAFYLHFYDPTKPLKWSHGEVDCPPVEEIPLEVIQLLPYEPPY